MKCRLLLALSVVTLIAVTGATSTTASTSKITRYQARTSNLINGVWYRQHIMGVPLTPTSRSYLRTRSAAYARWVYRYWKVVNREVIQRFQHPPYASAFACIHRYEGSWTDAGSPYYGGLQMDLGFQATYGGYLLRQKGTADHWTPVEQEWVAARAVGSGRGFYPWPNTARICGLL